MTETMMQICFSRTIRAWEYWTLNNGYFSILENSMLGLVSYSMVQYQVLNILHVEPCGEVFMMLTQYETQVFNI